MPTNTHEEQSAFRDRLAAELPAFVSFLLAWSIPTAIVASRTGVRHFQHPELLAALRETAPEMRLLELIDEYLAGGRAGCSLEGTASFIGRRLQEDPWLGARAAEALLRRSPVICGRYLSLLVQAFSARISSRTLHGVEHYTIHPAPMGLGQESGWRNGDVPPLPTHSHLILPPNIQQSSPPLHP